MDGLTAEAGQQGFDDRRDQKDEHKVGSGTAGKIVFSRLGHGSSQGFELRDKFRPTDPRGGIIHRRRCVTIARVATTRLTRVRNTREI